MFPSLPLRSWLDIVLGFLYGTISTVLVIRILRQLKKNNPPSVLIRTLAFYSSAIAVVTLLYASSLSRGLLVEWQRLKFQTGSERAVKILDIGYIQGKSGTIYRDNQGILEQIDPIPENNYSFPVVPAKNNCGVLFFLPILKADFVDSKSACLGYGSADVKVTYAMDNRGRVYLWRHGASEFAGAQNMIDAIGSGTMSCIFGGIILSVLALSRMLIGKIQKHVV